ncbi:C6 transcription factor protein [Rutstroemia sp. NJR-2017a WRK4]|nr:C6 transcription factor protein [Rutstroemia sp. NJR-2017a WRK4]
MVSTRHHPEEFPEPNLTPTRNPSTPTRNPSTPTRSQNTRRRTQWAHTPSNLTLIWLSISLPLVIWDAGYCFLRPYSMPGGSLHWPIWAPYELYGRVDYIYGWKAFNEHNGFTNAQTFLNVVETSMYLYYLYMLYAYGRASGAQGRGAPEGAGFLAEGRYIEGGKGARALLVGYSAAVMTVSKTLLYWLNEYYSGFENIGHNSVGNLIFLWIIPNLSVADRFSGAWLIVPSYIIYVTGSEIIQGLAVASGASPDEVSLSKEE